MKSKKLLKIAAIIFVLFMGTLVAAPYFLKGKFKELVLKTVNDKLNAKVAFDDIDISLFSSFPEVALKFSNLSVLNVAPFEKDTLFYSEEMSLDMPIKVLFKGKNDPVNITGVTIENAKLNLLANENGAVNYDIVKPTQDTTSSSSMILAIKKYEILTSNIVYNNQASNMVLKISDFNHSGSGDLSSEESKLDTQSEGKVSFNYNGSNFLLNSDVVLNALIGINLKTNTYSFLKNEGSVNGLPLIFDGKVILYNNEQQIDINFKTPTSSFKNFLAVVPQEYTKNLGVVNTTGDFKVYGVIKGANNNFRIPGFSIDMASNNASFHYPNLPKGVNDITIKASIRNETGQTKDTYVNVGAFNFRVDQDVFNSSALIKNLTSNPLVNATLKGTINLTNISRAYPVKLKEELTGLLKMDVTTQFDMDAVKKSDYSRINSKGIVDLSNFIYKSTEFKNSFNISKAVVNFNLATVELKQFNATTGKTDLSATGYVQNVIGFILSNKQLTGNFNLNSNIFSINDFMQDSPLTTTEKTTSKNNIKIPSFLDCTINASAKTVLYDNLTLKDVGGKLAIKDEKVTIENLNAGLFGGEIGVNGSVSTKEATPKFDMDLAMNSVNITQSFEGLNMFQKLMPIAKFIDGKLTTTIKVSGNLTNEFVPNLSTISGNAAAEMVTQNLDTKNSLLFTSLASQLKFIDLSKIDLTEIKTTLSFENGRVSVKPFTLKYKDINVTISGSHGFDQSLDYKASFLVPGKYLGNEVTGLLAKMSKDDVSKVRVPINAAIGGKLDKPSITTDYKSSVNSLVTQLVDFTKLKEKGRNILSDIIKNQVNKAVPTDSSKITNSKPTTIETAKPKEAVENLVKDKLKGLFGSKNKKKDSLK